MGKLILQSLNVNNVALSTLAGRAAIAINEEFDTPESSFLVKKIRYLLSMSGKTAGEGPLMVGLASGDASAAEIASAMTELNSLGPADTTETLTEDEAWTVWQNTIKAFEENGQAGVITCYKEISLGKGMVARENQGIDAFIFNADPSALTTGISVKGIIQLWGVWLHD